MKRLLYIIAPKESLDLVALYPDIRDRRLARARAWRKANKERHAAQSKAWRKANISGLPRRVSDVGSDRGLGASSATTEKPPQAKS